MAKAVEIRGIQDINGQQFIQYAYGTPPLPAPPNGGSEISYMSVEHMKQRIADVERALGEEALMLLLLAITYLKPDGTLANPNQVLNKTLTLDPFAAQPLKIT